MVLAAVILLHVPLFFALQSWTTTQRGSSAPLVVEFVLNADPVAALPMPRRKAPAASAPAPAPAARARTAVTPRATATPPVPAARLFSADGSIRIPSTLADDIAPKVVEGPNTFHIPVGDTWVLREPKAPIEFTDTRFAQAYLPGGMNPVEEACWRNKGFAFVMMVLGSRDCANPGGKDPRPTPQMIVYGVDDYDDIVRKTGDWQRYNAR